MTCQETVNIISEHTCITASKYRVPTDQFHKSFKALIQELVSANFPSGYLSDTANLLCRSYWEFFDLANRVQYIRSVLSWGKDPDFHHYLMVGLAIFVPEHNERHESALYDYP